MNATALPRSAAAPASASSPAWPCRSRSAPWLPAPPMPVPTRPSPRPAEVHRLPPEGSGGKIITVLSLAGGLIGLASGRFTLAQIAVPVGVGIGVGTGVPIVTSVVTAVI